MRVPSVVLDTNIVISAHLSDQGLPYRVFMLAMRRSLRLIVSAPILAEYEGVLLRPRFHFPIESVAESLALIRQNSVLVTPAATLAVSADESDNRFLECAETGKADYLVTGNQRHFPAVWNQTRILSARELIEVVFHL